MRTGPCIALGYRAKIKNHGFLGNLNIETFISLSCLQHPLLPPIIALHFYNYTS